MDANGCNVTVMFALKNVGKTPAVNVEIDARLSPNPPDTDRLGVQREVARVVRNRRKSPFGATIFPGDAYLSQLGISFSHEIADNIEKAWKESNGIDLDWFSPNIIGSIAYRSTLSDMTLQTGFIREIERVVPSATNSVAIGRSVGDIAQNHLILRLGFEDPIIE